MSGKLVDLGLQPARGGRQPVLIGAQRGLLDPQVAGLGKGGGAHHGCRVRHRAGLLGLEHGFFETRQGSADTPSGTGYSTPLTRCQYPYQVTASTGVNERSGPGTSHPVTGHLPGGALAWVWCQQPGTTVATTKVWDKLRDGSYVSGYYITTPARPATANPSPAA